MSLFSSKREKSLWLWALAAVIALYSTLGLAGALAGRLLEGGLLQYFFIFGAVLVFSAILTQGMAVRPGGMEIAVSLGLAAAFLLALTRLGFPPVERTHLIEYAVVAVLTHEALKERTDNGRRVPSPGILAFLLTAILGWIDEGIQFLLPNRVYDIRDFGFNAMAALMAITASVILTWVRARFGRS